jgi:transposase
LHAACIKSWIASTLAGSSSFLARRNVMISQDLGGRQTPYLPFGRCPKNRIKPKKFLDTIDANVPPELDVHLVLDNLSTHKAPIIRRWLAKRPRFHLHFTPTSSSWINMVERWFGLLTERQLRRGVHRSTVALEAAIESYIAVTNEQPKPFIWTKSADEILASVARFCRRTSDAGH